MFQDRRPLIASADPCPESAVSTGAGLAGLLGVGLWIGAARLLRLDGPYAALVMLAACALPMVIWSLGVDKVHRRPSTGIDWSQARGWRETREDSLIKLAGYWLTWAGIALFYFAGRFYWQGDYPFAMWCLGHAAPVVALLSIPYVFWLDRYLVEPRDGAWHLGAWLTGQAGWDVGMIQHHLRAWAVKGFFLAFMLAIVPSGFGNFVRADTSAVLHDPVALSGWLVTLMFTVDVAFATVGYILTFRPLDAHIRTANPFAAAWMAALICYPPFVLMAAGGPLDYHPGTSGWVYWIGGHPVVLTIWGAVLVALTAIYAWSTVAFGPRFSNLTHRGIITHGPYAWSRHPAYLSKNLFWWLSTIPVLSTGSLVDAARATLLMGAVSGVYYWRARTEERHLGQDPAYADYSAWMSRHAPVPRFFRWLGGHDRISDDAQTARA